MRPASNDLQYKDMLKNDIAEKCNRISQITTRDNGTFQNLILADSTPHFYSIEFVDHRYLARPKQREVAEMDQRQ